MGLLTLTLLGGFEARIGLRVLALPRKAQALLAYLAVAPGTTHPRSKLAALLWGDTGDDDARNNLRQVLFRMRRAFGRSSGVLTLGGDLIGLDPQAVRSDVAMFRRLVAESSDQALRLATELCAGNFLEGFDLGEPAFEEWLVGERERLHELAIGAFRTLIEREEARKATDGVITAGLGLLGLDATHEAAHRALMRARLRQPGTAPCCPASVPDLHRHPSARAADGTRAGDEGALSGAAAAISAADPGGRPGRPCRTTRTPKHVSRAPDRPGCGARRSDRRP